MDTPACETKAIISPTPHGSEILRFSFATARSRGDSVPFLPLPSAISIFLLFRGPKLSQAHVQMTALFTVFRLLHIF